MKVGLPLNLITFAVAILVIKTVFPFWAQSIRA